MVLRWIEIFMVLKQIEIFMVLRWIEKFLYWVKLKIHGSEMNWNFHGSETNWKFALPSQAKFSWFWDEFKFFMVLKQIENFLYWVKLNFHGSETNWNFHGSEMNWKFPLLSPAKISWFWDKSEKNLYRVKLNFHGSETNWKIPLLSQTNFSWFWNKSKKYFTDSSQFFNATSKVKLEFRWFSNKTPTCKVIIHLRTMKNTPIFSWFWVFLLQSKVIVGRVMNW